MNKNLKWYLLAAFVLFLLIGMFSVFIMHQQQAFLIYDFESTTAGGMNVLQRFLIKQDYNVSKLNSTTPDNSETLLIVLTGSLTESNQYQDILSWIKSGGTVIELTEDKPHLNLALASKKSKDDNYLHTIDSSEKVIKPNHQWFEGLPYKISNRRILGVSKPDIGLYGVSDKYFIFLQHYGLGTIITWCDPGGLANKSLANYPDNAIVFGTLLKNLKPTGNINVVDLRIPSYKHSVKISSYDLRYWIMLIIYLLSFIGLILWKLAARFGRAQPLTLARGRSYDEFIHFLAGLFQQANSSEVVIENLSSALVKTIVDITGLTPNTPIVDLIERLEEITHKNYSELKILLININQAVSKKNFLSIASKLDCYRKELLEWKKFN